MIPARRFEPRPVARRPGFEALASTGWLAEVPAPFRAEVLARCLVREFARGETVCRAGSGGSGLWGLAAGALAIEIAPEDAEPYVADIVGPGAWFCEDGVSARAGCGVTLRAARPCVLAHLPQAGWDAIAGADPEAWRWLAALAALNRRRALRLVDGLAIRDGGARVACLLLRLGESTPGGAVGGAEIDASQDEVAAMAGLSRSSLGRILAEFETEGLVERAYRRLRVLDGDGLRARARRR
jgi:CRP-like cAMP-binding protein